MKAPPLPTTFGMHLVLFCFFVSGATGLIYQTVWVRMIDKVIGSAPFAVATVLSVFMGGLALGSFLAGRYVDRVKGGERLLALYGRLEIAIAASAVVLPLAITIVTPLYRLAYALLFDRFRAYQAFSFAGCLTLLLVPTGLMGATLPVLCRFFVRHLDHLGNRTGRLYGLNTLGGAVGVMLCGLLFIEHLGVNATLGLAAGLNLLLGIVCLAVARIFRRQLGSTSWQESPRVERPRATFVPSSGAEGPVQDVRRGYVAVGLIAVSGFCAMAYEVFWIRLLGLIVGPTTYSFTIVVATFVVGLAAGSMFFGRVADRSRSPLAWLVATQMAASLLALVVSQFMGDSQFFFAKLIAAFEDRFAALLRVQTLILMGVLFLPTFALGASFPLVSRIFARDLRTVGRSIGTAYAANTVGAILGSLVAGFVLIPVLGKQGGLTVVCLGQLMVAGMAAVWAGRGGKGPAWRPALGGATLLLLFWVLGRYPSWDTALLSRGWYRDLGGIRAELERTGWWDAVAHGPNRLALQRQGTRVVFCGEGIGGFTTVEEEVTSLGTVEYALFNSGKPDASSHGDRCTQTLSGHFPMLFHRAPKRVMVLGLASGMTCGEVLHYPIEELHILEINEQVVQACRRFFGPWNNRCLDDPRCRVIVQDGRNHLELTGQRYDVIISEPSNPWMAGLANLYTLDFFRLVKRRLTPEGIFAQWIQSYEMDWRTFALLGRTFSKVFPQGSLIKIGPADYLLMGAAHGPPLDWETAGTRMQYAGKSHNAAFTHEAVLAQLVVTEDLPGLFGEGILHTDDRPRLEFAAPRQLHRGRLNVDRAAAGVRRLRPATREMCDRSAGPDALLNLVAFAASANAPAFAALDARTLSPSGKERYLDVVRSYCRRCLVTSYDLFNDAEAKEVCAQIHAERIIAHLEHQKPLPGDHYNLGLAHTAAGRLTEAAGAFERTLAQDPSHTRALTALGLLLAEEGRLAEAVGRLSQAVALNHRNLLAVKTLGVLLLDLGRLDEAAARFVSALALAPRDAESHHNLAMVLFRQGSLREAKEHFAQAVHLCPENPNTRHNLAVVTRRLETAADGREAIRESGGGSIDGPR